MVRSTFFTFLLIVSCAAIPVNNYDSAAIPYDPGFDIRAVIRTAVTLPIHSWEFGTASEALLELYDAKYSVYGSKPFPVPTINLEDSKSLTYAKQKIVIGAGQNALSDGDGAVGDPASLGVSAVLLGKTLPEYAKAAKVQAEYVYGSAPRYWNGAISHRADHPELWWVFACGVLYGIHIDFPGLTLSTWLLLSWPTMGWPLTMLLHSRKPSTSVSCIDRFSTRIQPQMLNLPKPIHQSLLVSGNTSSDRRGVTTAFGRQGTLGRRQA